MTDIGRAGTYRLGDRDVNRMGYGAMRLTGPGIYGPPKDRGEALPCFGKRSRAASTTSTPAIITGRTSSTRSFARRCRPIRTIWCS